MADLIALGSYLPESGSNSYSPKSRLENQQNVATQAEEVMLAYSKEKSIFSSFFGGLFGKSLKDSQTLPDLVEESAKVNGW